MNRPMIRYVLGQVIFIEGALLLLPCLVSLIYQENEGLPYLCVAVCCTILGYINTKHKPENNMFYLKEGCIMTGLSWIVLSFIGAIPFYLTGEIPSFIDAWFETISGFTTTGSSILSNVEALSHTALFWRSFTHWVGGMGVLVFLLAVIPMSGGANINLMRAESPGPSVEKILPKVKHSAIVLYVIYGALTVFFIVVFFIAGMPLFDSFVLAFGSAGTGGFAIRNDSLTSYSALQQWLVTIAMISFGVNFNFYYLLLLKKFSKAFHMEEVRAYFGVIIFAILVITLNILPMYSGHTATALRDAAFQVGSIITTTGYGSANFDLWPTLSKLILVLLMFVGACAGSTGGGMKISRFIIMIKSVRKEIHSYAHPKSIEKINMDGKPISHEVLRSTNVYMITYVTIFVVSLLGVAAFENTDLVTSFTSVAATINNIGPGLELVGPTANFGWMHNTTKVILMFDMLAGRLELFPILIMLYPRIWKDAIHNRRRRRRVDCHDPLVHEDEMVETFPYHLR